jgi:DNA-binding MarR family transcriptional regulator
MSEPIAKIAAIDTVLRNIYGDLQHAARDAGVRLTGPQAVVLLGLEDGQTPGDFERAGIYGGTNCSYNLTILQERGMIEREPVPDDGRSVRLKRTKRGREMADRLNKVLAKILPQHAPTLMKAAVLS